MADAADAPVVNNKELEQQRAMEQERLREASKLFRVHQTVCEMLADRGYDVAAAAKTDKAWLVNHNLDEFRAQIVNGSMPLNRGNLHFVCSKPGDTPGTRTSVLVWYEAGEKPSKDVKDAIVAVQKFAEEYECDNVIVVHTYKIPALIRSYIETCNREGKQAHLQLFPEDHLVVNITRHELVPKHEPLSIEETKKVLEAFALNISMLPRLLATDPVALYFGLKRGQVVRITRKSETAGQYVTFRQVV